SPTGCASPNTQYAYQVPGPPLGEAEIRAAKQPLGWPTEPSFLIPPEALQHFRSAVPRGQELEREWRRKTSAYASAFPDLAAELERRFAGTLPKGWDRDLPGFAADAKGLATRKASESVLQVPAPRLPELAGRPADLNPPTFTWPK